MIILDTHALLWVVKNEKKLGRKARSTIDEQWLSGEIAVSAISFWEIGQLAMSSRIRIEDSVAEWRNDLLMRGLVELPLDGGIALRALDLTSLHDDPTDRFIFATALEVRAALMTADERLLAYKHPLERIDARK